MRESLEERRKRLGLTAAPPTAATAPAPPAPERRRLAPERHPWRSPRFAAILSAILPGLGQAYGGRWRRAGLPLTVPLVALFVLGILALASGPVAGLLIRRAEIVVLLWCALAFAAHAAAVAEAYLVTGRPEDRRPGDAAVLAVLGLALVLAYGTVAPRVGGWAGVAAKVFAPPPAATEGSAPAATAAPVWSGTERLSVLVMGVDSHGPTDVDRNTDTMIVLTLDPLNRAAAMLSIPRDTFIDRPGVFQDKLNAAYAFGGPELTQRLVGDLLGTRIDAWALLDFDAFTRIVDGVGGVLVDVRRPLRDETYPTAAFGVQRLDILAGPQVLGGEAALRYARTRHASTDYDRAERQQTVIAALRSSLGSGDLLLRLPLLVDQVGSAVRTNFDPANVLAAARLGATLDRGAIRSEVLYPCGADFGHCELREVNGPGGFFLLPDKAKIADLAAQLFYDPRLKREAAVVELRSGGARAEAVAAVASRLAARAYTVGAPGPAASGPTAVYLRDPAKRLTAESLAALLGAGAVRSLAAGDPTTADVVAVIGADFRGLAGDAGR